MGAEEILCRLRREGNISREKLADGFCTVQQLALLESGRAEPAPQLLDVLLQRLGKSPDKLEVILSWDQYQIKEVFDQFERFVYKKEIKKAQALLSGALKSLAEKGGVWKMHYYRYCAMYEQYCASDWKRAEKYLIKALNLTLPGWTARKLDRYLISTLEIENLLALLEIQMRIGESRSGELEKRLSDCYDYITNILTDKEEKAKVLCKCAWLYAGFLLSQGQQQKAFLLCEEALELLRDCGISYFMLPLIDRMLACEGTQEQKHQKRKLENYRSVLVYVQKYGENWYPQASIYHSICKREYHLDSEIIQLERLSKGLTQEEICEGIFQSARSLSQIECCKSVPRKKSFELLMERLGLKGGRYCSNILTESFEVLELENEFIRMTVKEQQENLAKTINELKRRLVMELPENQRAIWSYENELERREHSRPAEELLEEAHQILHTTYNLREKGCYRVPFRREAFLIIQIAVLLGELGCLDKAEQLYRNLLQVYQDSKLPERYHFSTCSTIYNNLAKLLDSEELAKEGLRLDLYCGNLNTMYYKVFQIGLGKKKRCEAEEGRRLVQDAYWLCKLAKNPNRNWIENFYKDTYNKDILE